MKIYVFPADAHGCGHFRMIWPANVLQHLGYDVVIMPPNRQTGFLAQTADLPSGGQVLTGLQVPADADVIVLQRPGHPLQPQMIDLLRANGIAVVVDMDDDMTSIHQDNSAYHMYRHHSGSEFSWRYATESCKRATLVTTSTVALQKVYAGHGRGQVVDNFVPKAFLEFEKAETNCFGWAGSVSSHPNDLQVSAPSVQKLMDEGFCFQVVGDGRKVRSALRLRMNPPASGTTPLSEFAMTIARTFDVGMVPLAATNFNSAKSRLKGIEMSAVGVPWVASPRVEYRRLVKESGAGLLADTPKQWHQQLKRLLTEDALRKDLIEAGKTYMATQTYEQNAWRWMEAWDRAWQIQHG